MLLNHLSVSKRLRWLLLTSLLAIALIAYVTAFSINWFEAAKVTGRIIPSFVAIIDIDPDTLNLKSKGQWVTAYIQFPEGYNSEDIDAITILLNETIQPVLDPKYDFVTNSSEYLVDHNNDGIIERMVKFNRTQVAEYILSKGIMHGNVTLILIGQLTDGTLFEGSDIIRVRMPGDINIDGKVDVRDIALTAKTFGSYPDHPKWNPIADENEDNKIDIRDIALIAKNFGKTYP